MVDFLSAIVARIRRCRRLTAPVLLAAVLLSTPAGVPAPAAAVPKAGSVAATQVAEIEAYFNKLRSLRADFVQFEPNGGTSTGNLYYQRPDKMRLDYDKPNPVLIVANGWQVIYHDRKLDQVSHLLTSQTPLAFLLEKNVRLDGDVTVTDVEDINSEILVTLIQTDEPDLGSIQLAFGKQPLELRRWTVTDAQGLTTHILLERSEVDAKIDGKLFLLCDPDAVIKKEGC